MNTDTALEQSQVGLLDLSYESDSFWREANPASHPSPASAYELIEDAEGRFAIDRASGLISLANPETAHAEMGSVHPVRVRIRNPLSGYYEASFHLRVDTPLPTPVLADGTDVLACVEAASAGS